ncbi:hypothetical protein EAX61_08170 [Dokdonia sinensis]|uniref:DUF4870 domain-containing protein n=1 Tax=Dokdonia sinensis TaxID=2479847 RepID=A0A3M0G3I4_9FLAO|nr:hypothetical protein [Dokdonia sinensis]RMB59550.1 hypothetical protein EAX61_08170 [Dokdonia sinensis]
MSTPTSEGKNIAIIAYITFIGLIIAIVMNNDKKDPFASFHIRNMLGLILFGIINSFLARFIPVVPLLIWIGLFVFWIIGLIGAVQEERKELPVVGPLFQDWFKSL